jgi:molybdopterin molybdotransferase
MEDVPRKRLRVKLVEEITSDGRESYLRAIVTSQDGESYARLTGHQGSGNLLSLVQANSLLIIPSGVESLPPGSEVDAWLLDSA